MSYLYRLDQPDQPPLWSGSGTPSSSDPGWYLRYVIKLHQASTLHYDFRLELDGILLSWVFYAKPSLDPDNRRWSKHVDDHSLLGLLTERRIPEGEYGAGPLLVWDHGFYRPHPYGAGSHESAVRERLRLGHLSMEFKGERLKGLWHFERDWDNWWLRKGKDSFASAVQPLWDDRSVLTGRRLEDIR